MKRKLTFDLLRGSSDPPTQFHTSEQIGPKRHLTPEGFLLCEEVPIARIGWMMYGPGETPVKTNDTGYAMVSRDADTLFSQDTVASFVGKSVTNDHPPGGVTPINWNKVTVGTTHNVRRGTGDQADVLLADLLITHADAIKAVQQGKREVSAGYDADYETLAAGEGRQLNIIGNHIALVERGRCGPRCAIGDRQLTQLKGNPKMPTQVQNKARRRAVVSDEFRQRVLQAAVDEALLADEEENEEENDNHVHVHLHNSTKDSEKPMDKKEVPTADDPYEPRFAALESGQKEVKKTLDAISTMLKKTVDAGKAEADPEDEASEDGDDEVEKKKKKAETTDSAALETSYKAVIADAEVLVPGFHVPTFDSAAKRVATIDSMCAIRRKALDTVYATVDGKAMVEAIHGATFDLTGMSCVDVATLFRSAAGAKRLLNNRSATGDANRMANVDNVKTPVMTIAKLNELHRQTYKH